MGFDRGPSLGHEGVDFGLGLQDGVRGVLAEVADQLRVGGHLERARVREVLEVVRNGADGARIAAPVVSTLVTQYSKLGIGFQPLCSSTSAEMESFILTPYYRGISQDENKDEKTGSRALQTLAD